MSPRGKAHVRAAGSRSLVRITYQPGATLFHRLHPLNKVAWLLVGTGLVFLVRSPWVVAGAVALLVLALSAARLRLNGVRGTRLFISTALALGLLQILFARAGAVLVEVGPLVITAGGLEQAAYVTGRFLVVVLLSYLFVFTTEPSDLVYALMRAGLPYRYGFMLVTALRLVPVFEQEGQTVHNAQLARGVRYDVRSPRRLLTLARQFVMPLMVSAFSKVDALAVSMEGRCFGKYATRTFLREVRPTALDGVAAGLLVLICVAAGHWVCATGGS